MRSLRACTNVQVRQESYCPSRRSTYRCLEHWVMVQQIVTGVVGIASYRDWVSDSRTDDGEQCTSHESNEGFNREHVGEIAK